MSQTLESVLTELLAVTPVHTAVMKAGGVLTSTHHAGIFLLLRAKDQVTPWFLHTQTNKTLRLETQQQPIPTYQDAPFQMQNTARPAKIPTGFYK